MKLQIDNLDGLGPRDYTADIDAARSPKVTRKLNAASQLTFSLISVGGDFVVPGRGARVTLGRTNGQDVFTGYIESEPEYEYLGWGERGAMYRYNFVVLSDEFLLDEKRLSTRSPFVARSAGDALRQLTQDAMPGAFDLSPIQNLDTLPYYVPDPQKTWSQHASEISLLARGSYRVFNGEVLLTPIGAVGYTLNESDPNFCPQGLTLQPGNAIVNDVTVLGNLEPRAYVRDYFVGNGVSTRFYLSQPPFTKSSRTIFDEEFGDATLDPTRWNVADPAHAIVAGSGKLQIAGGTGADGATTVIFVEQMELGGAWVMEHGDVMFTSNVSSGIIGGLYLGGISAVNCLAGFQISPAGSVSQIQALINGAAAGSALLTVSGHHYVLTTRIYSQEIFRLQQTFHCTASPAGTGIGGSQVSADVRLVLEVHDIDPTNPASMVAPATILYDGVISGAPAFCTYALVNSPGLYCAIAFTRLLQAPDVEVRTSLPGQPYISRLVGPLSSGCECNVISGTTLDFFSAYVPATNQYVEVHYRGQYGSDSLLATVGRAMARVTNPAGITAQQRGIDNGVRSAVRHVKSPLARTTGDCENAALAVLSDGATAGWAGKYETWSDFLPGAAQDIFPGDALAIIVPSCSANFQAIVREIEITVQDLSGEHSRYKIQFADEAAKTLSFELAAATVSSPLNIDAITNAQVGSTVLADLTSAQITAVASTTASIDAGIPPPTGGGIEVRWSDQGWGQFNDENLAGRFTTQAFTLPRLTKVEDYFLRQYDASVPPRYSRHSAALHIDYPF
ncbi:MAG TPA: hypothetical protein VHV29_11275 [Terriglobales bacterium]|jgi:hypothetical protein|nr:hypothetical protein [Terriglobales bacterium]